MSKKPTVFIASSSEAISLAEAVNIKLESDVKVRLWANAFDPSSVTINTLIEKTIEADYAVFVFHTDDKTIIRENEYSSTRDNVILELGLFIGKLGLERCFILVPQSVERTFRLPSDLSGVTTLYYDDQEPELIDAVTSKCAQIKMKIKKIEAKEESSKSESEIDLLNKKINDAQSQIWRMNNELQRVQEQSRSYLEAIKSYFFSVAKPATPVEIKAWEDGAKTSYLKDVKIRERNIYYVDVDTVIPPLHGASAISVIAAKGVKIYGLDKWSHNSIYYMDGFRSDSPF